MTVVKLALLQLAPETTVQGNLEKGLDARKKADERGAALALFPETWSGRLRLDPKLPGA